MEDELSNEDLELLSDKARLIYEEQTGQWKIRLMSQVLLDEIGRYASVRGEQKCGVSSIANSIFSEDEFFSYIQLMIREFSEVCDDQGENINFLGNNLFSNSDGQSLRFMLSYAHEVAESYKDALFWCVRFLSTDMPPVYRPFIHAAANFHESYLTEIETLPTVLLSRSLILEYEEDTELPPIILTFGSNDKDHPFVKELNLLEKRLGRS